MNLHDFLVYYLDGNITCQIYDPNLDDTESILFEGRVYGAIENFSDAILYDITSPIEVDAKGVMYIPVETSY